VPEAVLALDAMGRRYPDAVTEALGDVESTSGSKVPRSLAISSRSGKTTLRVAACLLAALLGATTLLGQPREVWAAGPVDATKWLVEAQNADGGFGVSPGSASDPAMTGWVMLALEATGRNPLDIHQSGRSPMDFLRKHAETIDTTGDLERTILALSGAGVNARQFANQNLVKRLSGRRAADGSFEGQVNLTAFGILALRSVGATGAAVSGAAKWLRQSQNADGGWGLRPGSVSEPDTTGAVLQALAAAGASGLGGGVTYLRSTQEADGGWALLAQGPSNSPSTAWSVQGLIAAGVNPASVQINGRSGVEFLNARRQNDGHYRYSKSSDQHPVWTTAQALPAVSRKAFPLAVVTQGGGGSSSTGTDGSAGSGGSEQPGLIPPSAGSGRGALGDGLDPGPSAGASDNSGPVDEGLGSGGVPEGERVKTREGGAITVDPTPPLPSQPQALSDGSDWPFVVLGAGILLALTGLGVLYYRGPIF
jgi:prenyltransferase beta subunit